jgi:hypothetical protein
MKNLFLASGFLFLCGFAIGQAKDGTSELQQIGKQQPAALIYLPYSPEVVKKALNDYLSKSSDKQQKNAKGYLLSSNTLIVKSNKSSADMHFLIGLKDPNNKNQSAIYLKLNSSSNYADSAQTDIKFEMQDAKDYLNNLAVAIKPYASRLQSELQQKNLSDAKDKNTFLVLEGNKLEEQRKKIQVQIGENENYKRDKGLARKKTKNDRLIEENLTARLQSSNDITEQIAALTLLSN